jgi:hypothetical protein
MSQSRFTRKSCDHGHRIKINQQKANENKGRKINFK